MTLLITADLRQDMVLNFCLTVQFQSFSKMFVLYKIIKQPKRLLTL